MNGTVGRTTSLTASTMQYKTEAFDQSKSSDYPGEVDDWAADCPDKQAIANNIKNQNRATPGKLVLSENFLGAIEGESGEFNPPPMPSDLVTLVLLLGALTQPVRSENLARSVIGQAITSTQKPLDVFVMVACFEDTAMNLFDSLLADIPDSSRHRVSLHASTQNSEVFGDEILDETLERPIRSQLDDRVWDRLYSDEYFDSSTDYHRDSQQYRETYRGEVSRDFYPRFETHHTPQPDIAFEPPRSLPAVPVQPQYPMHNPVNHGFSQGFDPNHAPPPDSRFAAAGNMGAMPTQPYFHPFQAMGPHFAPAVDPQYLQQPNVMDQQMQIALNASVQSAGDATRNHRLTHYSNGAGSVKATFESQKPTNELAQTIRKLMNDNLTKLKDKDGYTATGGTSNLCLDEDGQDFISAEEFEYSEQFDDQATEWCLLKTGRSFNFVTANTAQSLIDSGNQHPQLARPFENGDFLRGQAVIDLMTSTLSSPAPGQTDALARPA